MRTPLSTPVTLATAEPPLSEDLFAAVVAAFRWAWELLCDEGAVDPMQAEEERINYEIERLLNQRVGGKRRAPMLRLFETVQREAQHQGADKFRNKPDLTFRPKSIPRGVINQDDWGLFAECKIIEGHDSSPRVYCQRGLQKFVDGRYASRMSVGLMVAYTRDGQLPAAALSGLLENAFATVMLRAAPGATDVAYSTHDRSGLTPPCAQVDVTHLWLDARPGRLRELSITNFKSILDHTIELGRINVFIGENGCGKTNILEALAMTAAVLTDKLSVEDLFNRGIRVAKPSITHSSFPGAESERIAFRCKLDSESEYVELEVDAQDGEAARQRSKQGPQQALRRLIGDFGIYNPNILALRGLHVVSRRAPIGLYGEILDKAILKMQPEIWADVLERAKCISWLDNIVVDVGDTLKSDGHKPGLSQSTLYFHDKFMRETSNIFSAENVNEGILHILFYLTLFVSEGTPKVLGIDNIDTALNPQLCRDLIEQLADLAAKHEKQALITTHNPAILDGLNLNDDDQRLFVVSRDDEGHTVTSRIKLKPSVAGAPVKYKLSELWMRGLIGGLPESF